MCEDEFSGHDHSYDDSVRSTDPPLTHEDGPIDPNDPRLDDQHR